MTKQSSSHKRNTSCKSIEVIGQIQARAGKILTFDDVFKELLKNYKKSRN